MSKNKRENLFFLSQWLHSRDSNSKFLFWTGQSIFTARARERDGFWYKATFFEAYHHARERFERAQCSEKRELKTKERVKRESATFATTTRRNCVAAWLALMVCAWEELKLVTSRHIASHGWLANHLNALRFRCWACDMRWNLHVMSNSSSVTTRECCQHTHTYKYTRKRVVGKQKRRFSVKNHRFGKQIQQIQNFMVR